jgi:hypothetical protein
MLFLDSAFPSKDRQKEKMGGSAHTLTLVLFKSLRVLAMYVATYLLWDTGLQVAPLLFWLLCIAAGASTWAYKPFTKPLQQSHVGGSLFTLLTLSGLWPPLMVLSFSCKGPSGYLP